MKLQLDFQNITDVFLYQESNHTKVISSVGTSGLVSIVFTEELLFSMMWVLFF